MTYRVSLKHSAERELDGLPKHTHVRIRPRLLMLEQEPRPFGVQKLHGRNDAYRLRVGDYRILYTIDDRLKHVEVIAVAHRREAYR